MRSKDSHVHTEKTKKTWLHPWLFLIVFIAFIAIDQLVKAWARHTLLEYQSPGFPWPGVFEITLTYNAGIAFGKFQGAGVIFTPVALAIALLCGVFSFRNSKLSNLTHVSLGMLAAGAIGNLIDRLWFGKVTDMLWFRLIDFPVFNVADTCITISACLLILQFVFEGKPSKVNVQTE